MTSEEKLKKMRDSATRAAHILIGAIQELDAEEAGQCLHPETEVMRTKGVVIKYCKNPECRQKINT